MIRSLRAALWLGLFAAALAAPAPAQVSLAGVTGVVTDAADAVIPGASVVITNIETGIEVQAEANEAGYYTLVSLVPNNRVWTRSRSLVSTCMKCSNIRV